MQYRLSIVFVFLAFSLYAQFPSLDGGKKTWALVAGVSEYQDKEITDLFYAHKDAQSFFDFLISPAGGSVPKEQVQLLLNESVTTPRLVEALYWLVDKAGEGDQVYIYFAGHGDTEDRLLGGLGFFLPSNSPSHSYYAGAFPLSTLQSFITTLSAKNKANVIMVADACHAGKLAGNAVNGAQYTNESLQQQFAKEIKILACGPDEFSQEGEQWGGGHGAFSFHLIEGLEGRADQDKNYKVTLFEIRSYLESKVPKETAPDSQYPLTLGDPKASIALVDPEIIAGIENAGSKPTGTMALVATRGRETLALAQTDSLGQDLYLAYQKAMEEKRLLSPDNNSAYYYYQQLANRPEFSSMEGTLRRNLAVALQDDAQQAVNAYLNTDPAEMARRWEQGSSAYAYVPAYLDKSAELLGPDHYMYSSIRAKEYYFEAMLLRMEGSEKEQETMIREALKKIEAALALEPRGAHLYNELGLIYSGLQDPGQELLAYRKAHELAPSWVMPVYNRAILEREQGHLDTALLLIKEAAFLKPDFATAQIQLGQVEYLKGNLPEAESAYLKSISLYENAAPEERDDENYPNVYYGLGNIYLQTNRPEKAREMYAQTIRLSPQHPYAHYALGIAMKRIGEHEEAIQEFQANLEITPEYLEPYYSISSSYAEQNDYEQALFWLEKALENGYANHKKILEDEKFSGIRETEAFKELMKRYFHE